MAFKERINPKTKKKEYKYRYYFYKDGKKRDSDTGWFSSKREAQLEGERLKAKKEQDEKNGAKPLNTRSYRVCSRSVLIQINYL